MEEEKGALLHKLIQIVNEISLITDFRCAIKKQYCNLSSRLKLLLPMFEEFRESKEEASEETFKALESLKEALEAAKELLRFGSEGSQIYSVLERKQIMNRCQEVTAQLEEALGGVSYEKLDISDEVKEQVEFVLSQFRRAKGRVDTSDTEMYEDLLSVYKNSDSDVDSAVLKRLAEKLQLLTISDLKQESLALHEMAVASGGDPGESIEKMSMLLRRIKDFVQTENPNIDAPASEQCLPSVADEKASTVGNPKSVVIPDDFRCPISLELIQDPVIVSTGQTYERACIEKWLEAGFGTCPKTQQTFSSKVLTPNYVLRSLIAQWCEANGIEPPKRRGCSKTSSSVCSPAERAKVDTLVCKLTSGNAEDQLSAAGKLCGLAKRNADNRICIAEAGAIPLLVDLLTTSNSRIQEYAVTALLNLSFCEENKGSIVRSGAVPGIIHVLKKGSMEARENAAAALFNLSMVDENKVTIGSLRAIPALVTLFSEGSPRGKKNAATTLFNLCIYQGNRGRAVRAGVVPILMRLLTEPEGGNVDESLAVLAILASHTEGKIAIGAAEAVPALVEVIRSGSPTNKENSASVLVHLSSADQHYLADAQELGLMGPLLDMAQNGTDRGKRKAGQLLEQMNRFIEQQKQIQMETPVHPDSHTQQS